MVSELVVGRQSSVVSHAKFFGILNLTPDSFSDGGKFNDVNLALEQTQKLINDGADVIDIGAESTRPGATPLNADEEWDRLKNILPAIINHVKKHHPKIEISLDSRHPKNVAHALNLGIDIINDVTGFENAEIIKLAAASGKKIVVMHNLGVPVDKNKIIPENLDVIEVLISWMKTKLKILEKAGIKKQNIIFDPGIGFGKNAHQSIKIIQNTNQLQTLGIPLLIGHSKKSFLDEINFEETKSREGKTILLSKELSKQGVEYLRVHDIKENKL